MTAPGSPPGSPFGPPQGLPDDEATVIKPIRTGAPAPMGFATGMGTGIGGAGGDDEVTVIKPRPPAPTPPPVDNSGHLPVGTWLAEFEITHLVAEGGFGVVYMAQDHSLGRKVALKEYIPSSLAMRPMGPGTMTVSVKSERYRETFEAGLKSFVNEARLLAQFDHPSLVKVYRFWEANGTAYMVMPFYKGVTLLQLLRQRGESPGEAWLMQLMAPLTEALRVIHAEQCFHRDIAPDNVILLEGSGRPLLLDFGAARRVIGDMTQALTVILKPGYAPVEQYAEVPGMKQGAWTDVYALAAVLHFAIMAKTPPPSVARMLNDTYVPLVQAAAGRYSPRFLAAIDAALAVVPDQRTQTIDEFRDALGLGGVVVAAGLDLNDLGSGGAQAPAPAAGWAPAATRPPGRAAPDPTAAPTAARSKLPLLAGGAVLAAAAIGGGLWFAMRPPTPAPAPAPQAQVAPAPAPVVAAAPAPSPEPAPAPPPPAAPEPFDPIREFEKVVNGAAPGFAVEGATSKPEFRIGRDNLGLQIKSSRDGHLTLMAYASDGNIIRLVPSDYIKINTRIRAGQTLTLPPPGSELKLTGPEGTDTFLAIVSAVPRDLSSARFRMREGMPMLNKTEAEASSAQHPGPLPALAGTAQCPPGGASCDESYGAAMFSSRQIR
ncbi:MAG: protein kinase domain-containing protein [Rubrivivax sp.]